MFLKPAFMDVLTPPQVATFVPNCSTAMMRAVFPSLLTRLGSAPRASRRSHHCFLTILNSHH